MRVELASGGSGGEAGGAGSSGSEVVDKKRVAEGQMVAGDWLLLFGLLPKRGEIYGGHDSWIGARARCRMKIQHFDAINCLCTQRNSTQHHQTCDMIVI